MSAMVSQITSLVIVCSTVYLGTDQRKHQSSASLGTNEFPAQMASNAENVSISWHHHDSLIVKVIPILKEVNTMLEVLKWCFDKYEVIYFSMQFTSK